MNNPKPSTRTNPEIQNQVSENRRDELRFIVIGDWGEKGKFSQREVARGMQKIILKEKIDFILTTGDNFYKSGVKDLNDPHFKKSFEEIYEFLEPVSWYVTLGNHDYMGDIQTLIDYSRINPAWILPSPYYFFEKKFSESEKVLFLITDTNEFIHIFDLLYYRSYMKEDKGKTQLDWMNASLNQNTFQWKIVVGHHPVYSAGEHGDTKILQEKFLDVLERNQVDIYLAGHDHDLQYLKHPGKKIHFLVSGAGSKFREMKSSPYSIFGSAEPGFLILTITTQEAVIRFINQEAKEIYRAVIQK